MMRHRPFRRIALAACVAGCLLASGGCDDEKPAEPKPVLPPSPLCERVGTGRSDINTPASMVSDWGQPLRVDEPVNTPCPHDAIEISSDGACLYVMYTEDILANIPPERILERHNNTYRLKRTGGPDEFADPEFHDLGRRNNEEKIGVSPQTFRDRTSLTSLNIP